MDPAYIRNNLYHTLLRPGGYPCNGNRDRLNLLTASTIGGQPAIPVSNNGTSVSISADRNTAIIGEPRYNGYLDDVWVFTYENGNWTQQGTKLSGSGVAEVWLP